MKVRAAESILGSEYLLRRWWSRDERRKATVFPLNSQTTSPVHPTPPFVNCTAMSSAPSPRNSEAPTPEAEVRANDLALMIGDGGPEAEEEGDDDLFGEDNDEDVKMDGVEHGKQESTGSLSPRLE